MRKYKVLIPELLADSVSVEHSGKLTKLFYEFSDKFPDSQKGRDLGRAFMEHWLAGYKKSGRWIDERG